MCSVCSEISVEPIIDKLGISAKSNVLPPLEILALGHMPLRQAQWGLKSGIDSHEQYKYMVLDVATSTTDTWWHCGVERPVVGPAHYGASRIGGE
ncbi:hypothetical protein PSACC_03730 [Paramicrosporidium saccamoebae]|uniref:Uncharacterized protein n=1 Tax=Paramicrosporidium saccamoebae TaxID=1246581 RepID=A0A2H9TF88_9FUNG|nr:hypothetical protein PSACC_03730 [Paramicrosporidium saccamoebae]